VKIFSLVLKLDRRTDRTRFAAGTNHIHQAVKSVEGPSPLCVCVLASSWHMFVEILFLKKVKYF